MGVTDFHVGLSCRGGTQTIEGQLLTLLHTYKLEYIAMNQFVIACVKQYSIKMKQVSQGGRMGHMLHV